MPKKCVINKGDKFGRLTILGETTRYITPNGNHSYRRFLCRCSCGNITKVTLSNLRYGHSKSCGCLSSELSAKRFRKHYFCNTRFYGSWRSMKQRCLNKNHMLYYRYGGRGIKICKRWLKFENFHKDLYKSFKKHSLKHGEKNTTLDRIDNNGDYEPSNCRWTTYKENANNK